MYKNNDEGLKKFLKEKKQRKLDRKTDVYDIIGTFPLLDKKIQIELYKIKGSIDNTIYINLKK